MKILLIFLSSILTYTILYGQIATPIKHVVVIGIDGLSTLGVRKALTPNMDSLIYHGTHTFRANAVMPTNSSPNWASMIMGAKPKQHKVKSNGWKVEDIRNKSLCGQPKGNIWPTMFKVLRQKYPADPIAIFADWGDFNRLVEDSVCTLKTHPNGADSTTLLAASYIITHRPLLTFVHLDLVDHAGHKFGHRSSEYFIAVQKSDTLVGHLITAIKLANIADSTVIILTADHGGRGHGHWGSAARVKKVPWIIAGPTIKQGFTLTDPFQIYDTAATVVYLLGASPPECWIGKPAKGAITFTD